MVNISCAICQDLFLPSDDIHFTPCGHFFHLNCVTNWLARSKSCPQCRDKVTNRSIHRAYFTISTDEIKEDSTVLQCKIDSLHFQLSMKDKDLRTAGEEIEQLKKQASGLRIEVRKLESDYDKQRSAIHAYKEQLKYLKSVNSENEAAKKEIVRLRNNLQEYRYVQKLISDSQDEVDKMMSETTDRISLITYVSVMKREMLSNQQRCKELRERLRRLERERLSLKTERDNLLHHEVECRQLEEDLLHSEAEKESLRAKLEELEIRLLSKSGESKEDLHRFIAESPAPERVRASRENVIIPGTPDSDESRTPEKLKMQNVTIPVSSESEEISPKAPQIPKTKKTSSHLSVQSEGACGYSSLSQKSMKSRPLASSLSIMTKKPRLMQSLKTTGESQKTYFDGFGGQIKEENFPSPILEFKPKVIKQSLMSVKVKRRKLGDGSSKKLDDYFVDLT